MEIKEKGKKGISVHVSLMAIIVITFIAFLPIIKNGYVFLDDPDYVLNNPLMSASLKTIFTSFYLDNYHPLTILVYTLEHNFFNSEMMGYHFVSLLLHISNSLLVFFFIYYLLDKKNTVIPMITSLLFGIHPIHIESVAWASELKDVLYAFFFLLSLVSYVLFVQKEKGIKYLLYSFGFYILSLLSKGQAVTLPLCLLLIDYFLKRKLKSKMLFEKIPFFILSMVFGIIAIIAQSGSPTHQKYNFHNIFWGFYAMILYLFKFVLPVRLSGIYPYPFDTDLSIPAFVYFSPVIFVTLFIVVFAFFRKNVYVIFGTVFFLANIFTLVKFIKVGDAIIADRYSYISFIGLFFVTGYGGWRLINLTENYRIKNIIQFAGVLLIIILSTLTWSRTLIWKNSYTFWGDVSNKYNYYWRPYYCLGQMEYEKGNYKSAINYYSLAIEKDKYCPPLVYLWRGRTYFAKIMNYDSAIADLNRVLAFGNKKDPTQTEGRWELSLAYYRKGKFDDALKICNELIAMDSNDSKAYLQRALIYENGNHPQIQWALNDFKRTLQIDPKNKSAYLNRGSLYVDNLGEYDAGIADFSKVLELDPANTDAVLSKGIAYYRMENYEQALNSFTSLVDREHDNGNLFYLIALSWSGKKNYTKALQYARQAQKAGYTINAELLKKWESQSYLLK